MAGSFHVLNRTYSPFFRCFLFKNLDWHRAFVTVFPSCFFSLTSSLFSLNEMVL